MGKVFKALEKAGIDASVLGKAGQLRNMTEEELEAHEKESQAEEQQEVVEEKSTMVVPPPPPPQSSPRAERAKKSVPVPSTFNKAPAGPVKTTQAGPWDERLVKVTTQGSREAESFRMLRSKILYPGEGKKVPRTIMVVSAAPSEGKGFVTANLGISLARGMDQHSLIVDCDLRRPSLARLFGLSNEFGVVNCLQEGRNVSELLQKTSIDKLSILGSGKSPANPAELLGSSRMEALIEELGERYEDRFVIFDCAPGQVAPESFVLAKRVDCVVVVVRYGRSNRNHVKKLVDTIGRDKIIGIVFNGLEITALEERVFGDYGTYGEYTEEGT